MSFGPFFCRPNFSGSGEKGGARTVGPDANFNLADFGPILVCGPVGPTLICRTPLPPRRLWDRRGFTRQPENSKFAHFRGPDLRKHNQNSTRRHPERDIKEREWWRDGGKNSAEFWALHPSVPPPLRARGRPHPSGPHPSGPHRPGQPDNSDPDRSQPDHRPNRTASPPSPPDPDRSDALRKDVKMIFKKNVYFDGMVPSVSAEPPKMFAFFFPLPPTIFIHSSISW